MQYRASSRFYKITNRGPRVLSTEKNISWEVAKGSIMEVLNDCIDTWCNKDVIDQSTLTEQNESTKLKERLMKKKTILAKKYN